MDVSKGLSRLDTLQDLENILAEKADVVNKISTELGVGPLGRKADFKIVFVDGQFGTGRHEFSFEFASIQAIPKLAKRI